MSKTIFEKLPVRYNHLLCEEDYIKVLELVQDFLENYGNIENISDGVIFFDDNSHEHHQIPMDNLIRTLSGENLYSWEKHIEEHFEKLLNKPELQYNLWDFDSIKHMLSLRVYPDGYFESVDFQGKIIYTVDFELTKTTLVFDFPEKFTPVESKYFKKWGLEKEKVFEVAQKNINKQKVTIDKKSYPEGFELYTFFSGDYSVSYLRDFEKNAGFAKGNYGSLVMIPTRGSGFVHPINGREISLVIGEIHNMIFNFYEEDPGPINANYYWYFNNRFTMFPISIDKDGYTNYFLPKELHAMIMKKVEG
ncbi:MAG: hypothetical protein M3512_12310 [Bacteroidota bacterium]|nr:hypothetical protein [Bacteroidota bacterium]